MDEKLIRCKKENIKLRYEINQDTKEYLENQIRLLEERITELERKQSWTDILLESRDQRSTHKRRRFL